MGSVAQDTSRNARRTPAGELSQHQMWRKVAGEPYVDTMKEAKSRGRKQKMERKKKGRHEDWTTKENNTIHQGTDGKWPDGLARSGRFSDDFFFLSHFSLDLAGRGTQPQPRRKTRTHARDGTICIPTPSIANTCRYPHYLATDHIGRGHQQLLPSRTARELLFTLLYLLGESCVGLSIHLHLICRGAADGYLRASIQHDVLDFWLFTFPRLLFSLGLRPCPRTYTFTHRT